MKKVLGILGLLLVLFVVGVWFFYFRGSKNVVNGPKPDPLKTGRHSEAFNNNVDSLLDAYYRMTDGFVDWDTARINREAAAVRSSLESFRLSELQQDTSKDAQVIYATAVDFVSNSKNEAASIGLNNPIEKKRESLNSLTDNLRNLLLVIHYDREKVYYMESPTGLNESFPGFWLSPTEDVKNPYYGRKHPAQQDKMLTDGNSRGLVVKDTTGK